MMSKADKLFISLLVWMPAISNKLNPLLRVFSGVRCVIGRHQLLSCLVQFLLVFFLIYREGDSPPSTAELDSQRPHFGNEQKPGLETGEEPWASGVPPMFISLSVTARAHAHAQRERERESESFSLCVSWLSLQTL